MIAPKYCVELRSKERWYMVKACDTYMDADEFATNVDQGLLAFRDVGYYRISHAGQTLRTGIVKAFGRRNP